MAYNPRVSFSIDEDNTLLPLQKLDPSDNDYLLKINFKEYSTSFQYKLQDNSTNTLNMPNIKITNVTLSDNLNTGNLAVKFNKTDYIFDSIYITKPGNYYVDYKKKGHSYISQKDPSGSSLLIVCKKKTLYDFSITDYLTIVIPVLNNSTIIDSTYKNTLDDIINRIKEINENNNSTSAEPKSISKSININNLIPESNYYYYKDSENTYGHNNYIIFPSDNAIKYNNTYINNFNNLLTRNIHKKPEDLISEDLILTSTRPISRSLNEDDESQIYIYCQPTDQEGSLLVSNSTINDKEKQFFQLPELPSISTDSWITNALIGVLIMLIIMKAGELILKKGSYQLRNIL